MGLPDPLLDRWEDDPGQVLEDFQTVGEALSPIAKVINAPVQEAVEEAVAAKEHGESVDSAKRNLQGGGSVSKSDELLDDGAIGLDFFKQFLPLYKKWKGDGPEFEQLKKRYDEFRGIDFAAFRKDAEMLDKVQQELLEQNDSMGKAVDSAKETWQGEAADSAGAKVGDFNRAGTTVTNETEKFGGAIGPTMDGITDAVREYAKFVVDVGSKLQCAGKTPDEVQDEIRKANGDLTPPDLADVGLDGLFDSATAFLKGAVETYICSFTILGPLAGFKGLIDSAKSLRNGIIDDAKKWLDESFVPELQNKYSQFTQQTDSTVQTIEEAYQKLLQEGEVTEDPFSGIAEEGSGQPAQNSGQPDQGSGQSQSAQPTQSAQSAQPSGGETGGGGGGDASDGGGASNPPSPEDQLPESPGGPDPGGDDSDGPPGGDVDGPPGEEADGPREVTLGEGKESVSLREPDSDGTVEVEMAGPDGEPKKYAVALGEDSEGGPDSAGKPGPEQEGRPGSGDASPGRGGDGDGAVSIRPGEDGKAVIEEGDRTVTLERTPEGRVAVSVDNGGDEPPTHQTVQFGEDSDGPRPGGPRDGPGSPGDGPGQPGRGAPDAAQPGHGPGDSVRPHASPDPAQGAPAPGPNAQGPMSQGPAAPGGGAFDPPGAGPDAGPGSSDGPAATTAQSATLGSAFSANAGASVGSMTGDLFGGTGTDSGLAQPGFAGAGESGDGSRAMSASDGHAGAGGGQSGSAAGAGGAAGGGGMGGMGMMGGGMGQQGGDQERSNDSPWRTEGHLFDDGVPQSNVRYRSVIGEDERKKG